MKNNSSIRSVLAEGMLLNSPPLIQESLLNNPSFRKEFGFIDEAIISFINYDVLFSRSVLYGAIKMILSGKPEMQVTDTEGKKWNLKNIDSDDDLPRFKLTYKKHSIILAEYFMLSPEIDIRLKSFDKSAKKANLPIKSKDEWRNILSTRPFTDGETDEYINDIRYTPVSYAKLIFDEILKKEWNIKFIVPNNRIYYERLVGTYDDTISIEDYAINSGRTIFHELSSWHPYDGFLYSLLLSSNYHLTSEIKVDSLSDEELLHAYEFLEKSGDKISQIGAIEVGLRILSSRPEIELVLIRLIEKIRDEDPDENSNDFKILSALFILVDSELSRIHLFSKTPPFYRRIISFAQAALIQRQIIKAKIKLATFSEWVENSQGQQFYLQTLVDLRQEPRWHPEYATAHHFKADFLGRIMISAIRHEENIKGTKIYQLIFGSDIKSITNSCQFPHSYLPSPLEGNEKSTNNLPNRYIEIIEKQLKSNEVEISSFIALVNSSLIYNINLDQATLAAKALKLANHRLKKIEDRIQLMTIIYGLATVSATTRSSELANELKILVRRYRRDVEYKLTFDESMRIGMVTAASHTDFTSWSEFIGECFTELAFEDLDVDEGLALHSHLKCLLNIVPELWINCGRSEAALNAFNACDNNIKSVKKQKTKSKNNKNLNKPLLDESIQSSSHWQKLINNGESDKVEFKATLRIDLKTKKVEKFIEYSVIKTIAALLNSSGGTLFIGVEDNKNILGIELDLKSFKKTDKLDEFKKHFDNLISKSIGNKFYHYLNVEFPSLSGKIICVVTIKKKSKNPVFITDQKRNEKFYIRRLASTTELKPREASEYIREHWDK